MIRAKRLIPILLLTALASACASTPETKPWTETTRPTLTDAQVQKYINSYVPIQEMMSAYWGKRRYSPLNKMLPPQGTPDRAVEEMSAAGTLPDFELLLQSHGYDSVAAWKATGERIGYAYATIRMETLDPARLILQRQARQKQIASIAEHRTKLLAQGDAASRAQLQDLDIMQNQVERGLQAEADAAVLRPYFAQLDALNKDVIRRERQ